MKKIIILTLFSSLFLAGCQDYLVEAPKLSQTTELTLSTYSGLNSSVAGAYSPLVSSTWYGSDFMLCSELRSGNAKIPTNTDFQSGRLTLPYFMTYNESSTTGLWAYAYYVISAVNNVIENLDTIEVSSDVSQQDIDNLRAEALFLRALAHFDALRIYSHSYAKGSDGMGIPVILITDKTGTEQPARNTIEETYAQIIDDLTTAEELMDPTYYRSDFTDKAASASIYAVQALLSRVYLYKQDWQLAADYATKVIDSKVYNLWDAETIASDDTWGAEAAATGGEVIFEIYSVTANTYDAYWECASYLTNPAGYADCAASADLVALYEADDVRGTLFQTDAEEASAGELWTTKYIGKGNGTPDVNNTIVLRLSEMYLNRAEALVNGAAIEGVTAVSDANAIATRAGASAYSSVGSTIILNERRKELAFEGHYWFDLARTKSSLSYSDAAVTRDLAADAALWALPIPKRETDVNSNLVQNEY